jgi:diguanylate cyclase
MSPVEIARQALRRLTQLGLPPTPENYESEYRAIAGPPPRNTASASAAGSTAGEDRLVASPAAASSPSLETLDMVRALLQVMTSANAGLHADLTRFTDESSSLLAQVEGSQDPKAIEDLFKAMTASSNWLLSQVDSARTELENTREQLSRVHHDLERAQELAISDPLTGLPNRRALDEVLSREIARARRHKTHLCVAVLDVDHFKRINDTHGHAVGDRALVHLANTIRGAVRETDVLARLGGEEFVLVLPDTPLPGAEFTLNRLLRRSQSTPLAHQQQPITVAFSAGLALWQPNEAAEQILQRADQAMYRAKAGGRGQVMVAEAH